MKFREDEELGIIDIFLTSTSVEQITGYESIIYGRTPENEDEVVVSTTLYNSLTIQQQGELFLTDYYVNIANSHLIKVVGIYDSYDHNIRIHVETYEYLYNPLPKTIQVYLMDPQDTDNYIQDVTSGGDYLAISVYQNLRNNISETLYFSQNIMMIVSALLCIMATLMVCGFIKILVSERTYEIAIIKSFGARKSMLLIVLTIDILISMIISVLLSFLFTAIILEILPYIFVEYQMLDLEYPLSQLFLILTLVVVISMSSVYLFSRTKLNQNISQLMKQRN